MRPPPLSAKEEKISIFYCEALCDSLSVKGAI